jgi:hypothetical protein
MLHFSWRNWFARVGICLAVTILAMPLTGCDEKQPVEILPIKGKLTINGKPAKGVYLQFHRLGISPGSAPPDGAKTDADGSFIVPAHDPGDYAVTAFWPEVTLVEGEELEGADRFNGSFTNVDQPVKKVTIKAGENVLETINLRTQ